MGLQLLRRARLRLPVPGNVQGTISPVIQTTFHPLPTIVVPPETNSKVSDQLLVPPQAQTMRPEITFGPSNTSVMQREMTPEPSDPTVMQPEITSEPSETSVKPARFGRCFIGDSRKLGSASEQIRYTNLLVCYPGELHCIIDDKKKPSTTTATANWF